MLSVICKPFMLNVVMLSNVEPHYQPPLSPVQTDELRGVATTHTMGLLLAKGSNSRPHREGEIPLTCIAIRTGDW